MTFPHCDSKVLHAPRECRFCDRYPNDQRMREIAGVNFTGHSDPAKRSCPSECQRSLNTINHWPGNIPQPLGRPIVTYFGRIEGSEWDDN